MVGEGYWRWTRPGAYRGIPMSNFLGWFVTGVGIIALLDAVLPVADDPADADGTLVGQYAYMGVMETVGFARFFRDPGGRHRGRARHVADRRRRDREEAPWLTTGCGAWSSSAAASAA